jgi:RND family efflux transporter MFP subunit
MARLRLPERRILVPLGLLGVGVLGAILLVLTRPRLQPRPSEAPVPLVRTLEVQPRSVQLRVRTHGSVRPRTESELVPEVSGRLVWVSPAMATGGTFQADEPLLRIDPADYKVALERARAAVARTESEHVRAAKELDRRRSLAERNAASAAQLDDAVNNFGVAQAALREARAELERAQRDLERTEIRAPFTGRVREEQVDVGQFVSRGSAVASLYAIDYAELSLPVPDQDLAHLELPAYYRGGQGARGPDVVLHAELGGARRTWQGYVVRTEGEIDARTRMLRLVARVDDPYGLQATDRVPLPIGLFVDAEILGREVPDAVVLPRAALRDGSRVLVLDADSRLRFREVQLVRVAEDEVVVGGGLSAGERVCVSPLEVVVDGMRVRAAEPAPGAPAPAAGAPPGSGTAPAAAGRAPGSS